MSTAALASCLGLPSSEHVAQKFKRDHPTYIVQSVSQNITTSPGSTIADHAVFRVVYTTPGDPRPRTYQRKYGRVAEGWLEVPSKTPEE
jgi:hypothetical protein